MLRTAVLATVNETRKNVLVIMSYRFNLLAELLTLFFVYTGVMFMIGDGKFDPVRMAPTLLGYLVWYYALIAIGNMSYGLAEETQTGTLEQMYMSPAPTGMLLLGRSLATFIWSTGQILLLGLIIVVLLNIQIPLRAEGLVPFAFTMIGLFGFGFMIGGATLVFKHVQALSNLIQNLLLFLNGSILPVDKFPHWLELIARALPSTQGIIVLRNVVLNGQSLSDTWADGSLPFLVIHSLVYFVGGLLIFKYCEGIARRRGSLGQY